MTARKKSAGRRKAVSDIKRRLILDAARRIFESEGLDGASLRAIATEAGYTPAALYFHFDSKEAIYAEVLRECIGALGDAIERAVASAASAQQRFRKAAMTLFNYYAKNPRELDLGFYLLRGGMKPKGLGKERDVALNRALADALAQIGRAAEELGADEEQGRMLVVDVFAHAAGLLLLAHTGRIRMFGASAVKHMERYIDQQIAALL